MIKGRIFAVGGASQSGKTTWTMGQVQRQPRAAAWDPDDQWSRLPGWQRVTTRADLAAVMRRPGPWRVAFVTDGSLPAEFEFWTRCVFAALETGGPLAAVAEELADVSTPAKAPPGWGLLVRRSKKRGVQLYAISQRWAEADKTILGNADEWVLFSQASLDDVRYLARKSRLEFDTLAALRPFEFVRYDCGAKQICEAAKVRKRR